MGALAPVALAARRSRVYRGRVLRMATRQRLSSPCIFMHVPKCGGTSLSEALYALVPLHRKIGVIDSPSLRRALALQHAGTDDVVTFHDEGERADEITAVRETLLLMHLFQGADLIHGHFLFSEAAFQQFGARYRYVSILRDPLARTVSNFRMARRNGNFDGDFDAFLEAPMGRRMALHTLRYFSGQATVAPQNEADAVERAKTNMARFAVIGFIEDLGDFVSRFHDVFGARPQVGHQNRADGETFDLTADQRRRLEALCAPDLALTDFARTLV